MITAVSIVLYFIAALFLGVFARLVTDKDKEDGKKHASAIFFVIFFVMAVSLQIFG